MRITLRRVKTWAIVLPILFLLGLEGIQYAVLEPRMSREAVHATMAVIFLLGVVMFSSIVWRAVERIEAELQSAYDAARAQSEQLAALHTAALQITSERDPDAVLQQVVESSCHVLGARYGALSVLGPGNTIERFVTTGMDPATLAKLGPPPKGHGILGIVTASRKPLRLDDLTSHPSFSGFPPDHPPMKTLLAVPVLYKDNLLGNLYLSERPDGRPFTSQDAETLERFAAQAAIAVANARLYERAQRLSAMEERERIAMDLHDGVIQQIYAVGLSLEAAADQVQTQPARVRDDLERAMDRLSAIVEDIRHYIMDLRTHRMADDAFPTMMRTLLDSTGADPEVVKKLKVDGDFGDLSRHLQWELWHIAHEALSNAVRHGHPRLLSLTLARDNGRVRLTAADDGIGFDPGRSDPGAALHQGLSNMRRRAEALGGTFTVRSAPGQGTSVEIDVPVKTDIATLEG